MHLCNKMHFAARFVLKNVCQSAKLGKYLNIHSKSCAYFSSSALPLKKKVISIKPFWNINAKFSDIEFNVTTNLSNEIKITSEDGGVKCFEVTEDVDTESVNISANGDKEKTVMHISTPLRVDLNILADGCGTGTISDIENNSLRVRAMNHTIKLQNIKSNLVSVNTQKGDILCSKTLRGDIELACADGNIKTDKLQGNTISLATNTGSITAGDLYAEDLSLVANNGSTRITSIHGDSELQIKEDIVVGTAEGKFSAWSEEGNIQVYLTDKIQSADIVTNTGNISLSISDDLGCQLDVEAQEVDDSATPNSFQEVQKREQKPCIRYRAELKDGGPRISVKALGGLAKLRTSSWLDAVSLYNKTKR